MEKQTKMQTHLASEKDNLFVLQDVRNQCKIILLDESTASIDAHSDLIAQNAIKEEFKKPQSLL